MPDPNPAAEAVAALGLAPAPEEETPPTEPEPKPDNVDPAVLAKADNPDAVKRAIEAERKTAREANARAREYQTRLQAREDAEKPLEERIAALEAKSAAALDKALRYEVASQAGLPLDLAARLIGNTEEEMLADAKSLRGRLSDAPRPSVIEPEGGLREAPQEKKDPAAEHNNFLLAALGAQQNRTPQMGGSPLAGLEPAPEDDE